MAKKKTKNQSAALSPERFLKEKANKLPIYKCLISKNYKDAGEAMVTIARERGNGKLCVANFLIDAFCLGVKDVFGNVNLEKDQFREYVENNEDLLMECDYALAHNYIYGAVEFAGEADIEPAASYRTWKYILDEDTDDVPYIDMEFGHKGKYLLVADPGTKEALLIPKLREKLGDNFDYILGEVNDSFGNIDSEEDYLEKERCLFHYDYPEYPSDPKLNHPFIKDLMVDEGNFDYLPKNEVKKILNLPTEEVEEDLLNLILWEIGRTYPLINENPESYQEDSLILHSLLLLAIMESKNGFKAGMEILRQSVDFVDAHLNYEASEYIVPAIVNSPIGKEQLEEIRTYLDERGHVPSNLVILSEALPMIVAKHPALREDVLSIIKDFMKKMPERLKEGNWYNPEVPGFFACAILDLNASELLPEIEEVFTTCEVDTSISGDLDDIKEELQIPHTQPDNVRLASKETLMKYLTE